VHVGYASITSLRSTESQILIEVTSHLHRKQEVLGTHLEVLSGEFERCVLEVDVESRRI
jgi:hypothetical protein